MLARELKRPGVNLSVLWEEYRQVHPEGYGYSRFCELFRHFEQHLSPVMRQDHVAGDKGFVDYSGKKVPIIDPKTGVIREAEIFVGVLGASSYTFAAESMQSIRAWSQQLSDWIGSHVRMFEFYQDVPRLLIPDNLKSGVNKASFYDPEIKCGVQINVALGFKIQGDRAEAGFERHITDQPVLIGSLPKLEQEIQLCSRSYFDIPGTYHVIERVHGRTLANDISSIALNMVRLATP